MSKSSARRAQTITAPPGEWRHPQKTMMRAQLDAICTRVQGGLEGVAETLRVNPGTIRAWKSRGSVTTAYADRMCALVPELGVQPWMICSKIALALAAKRAKEGACHG